MTDIIAPIKPKLNIKFSPSEAKALKEVIEHANWTSLHEPYRSVAREPVQKFYLRLQRALLNLVPGKSLRITMSATEAAGMLLIMRTANLWIHQSDTYNLYISNKIVSLTDQYLK